MMKSKYTLRAVLIAFAIAAAMIGLMLPEDSPAAKAQDGEFVLAVDPIYESNEDIVVRLRIYASTPVYRQVWTRRLTDGWLGAPFEIHPQFHADAADEGEIWLFGSILKLGTERFIKTVMGSRATIRTAVEKSVENPRLRILIKSGTYPIGKLLRIGKVNGDTVYLAVGEQDHLRRLRRLTCEGPELAVNSGRRAPCYRLRSIA